MINIVAGRTSEIGSELASNPIVRKLTFTGYTAVGKKLMADCAATVKRTSMELGGNAPFIVFDDADLDAAVAGAIICKFRNAGQTCVCANRIMIQDGVYDEFAEKFEAAAAAFLKPLGDALPRVVEWFSCWCRQDPAEPHLHLGPIGVSPDLQGQGVGTALMNYYIDRLETEAIAGYLETNKPENVEFYRKFGFVVRQEEDVIGTSNWYMWRPRPE